MLHRLQTVERAVVGAFVYWLGIPVLEMPDEPIELRGSVAHGLATGIAAERALAAYRASQMDGVAAAAHAPPSLKICVGTVPYVSRGAANAVDSRPAHAAGAR